VQFFVDLIYVLLLVTISMVIAALAYGATLENLNSSPFESSAPIQTQAVPVIQPN